MVVVGCVVKDVVDVVVIKGHLFFASFAQTLSHSTLQHHESSPHTTVSHNESTAHPVIPCVTSVQLQQKLPELLILIMTYKN